jgi:hypothetical protein
MPVFAVLHPNTPAELALVSMFRKAPFKLKMSTVSAMANQRLISQGVVQVFHPVLYCPLQCMPISYGILKLC